MPPTHDGEKSYESAKRTPGGHVLVEHDFNVWLCLRCQLRSDTDDWGDEQCLGRPDHPDLKRRQEE